MTTSNYWKNQIPSPDANNKQNYTLKNKTSFSYFVDDDIIMINFSEGKYDFNCIEATLNIYKNVKSSVIISRAIFGSPKDIMMAIDQMHLNVHQLNDSHFNKNFVKSIEKYRDDLLSIHMLFNK